MYNLCNIPSVCQRQAFKQRKAIHCNTTSKQPQRTFSYNTVTIHSFLIKNLGLENFRHECKVKVLTVFANLLKYRLLLNQIPMNKKPNKPLPVLKFLR